MDPLQEYIQLETRRQFFRKGAMGLGGAALSSLLLNDQAGGFTRADYYAGIPTTAPEHDADNDRICRGISMAMGDLDGDNRPDLVLGCYGQNVAIMVNDGSGGFDFPASRVARRTGVGSNAPSGARSSTATSS